MIVPTIDEAENLQVLVPRIAHALAGVPLEILIVDDRSTDGTSEVCRDLARTHPVQLLTRDRPEHGLSGAVLHGLAHATGEVCVVMDADLQHPPEALPEIVRPIREGRADFVLASRHVAGATTAVAWSEVRRINSWAARVLARPICGRITDPMSGFFAVSREAYGQSRGLAPMGFKIALEILCRNPWMRVHEVPIHFGLRQHGRSKLSLREQARYLEHLSRLYDHRFPRAAPITKFLVAYALGCAVALPFFLLLHAQGAGVVLATVGALLVSTAVQASLHWRYLSAEAGRIQIRHPWMGFLAMVLIELGLCAAVATWLMSELKRPAPLKIFFLSIFATAVSRYILRKELRHDIRALKQSTRDSHSG